MKKSFTAHQNLIRQVIERQAGTLEKALMEGVMNSIDAGASGINIDFQYEPCEGAITRVIIRDDGRGFKSLKEINLCFGTFGQPHEMEGATSVDARYGTFRIGRGQMFAFGVNTWRTGKYSIKVDIKQGLNYVTTRLPDKFKGTRVQIDLFVPLKPYYFRWTRDALEKLIRYSPTPVTVEFLDAPPEYAEAPREIGARMAEPWTLEQDGFQYRVDAGAESLSVYCDGMFVETIYTSTCGLRGHLNAPKGLKLNTARNSVIRDCPLWLKMTGTIKDLALELFKGRKTFILAEVQAFWRGVSAWGLTGQGLVTFLHNRKLIPVSDGSMISGKTLKSWYGLRGRFRHARPYRAFLVPQGDRLADQALQYNVALPLDARLEEWVGKSFIVDILPAGVSLVDATDLARDLEQTDPTVVLPFDYTAWERRFITIASLITANNVKKRRIQIGICPERLAWTDGQTMIVCERAWVKRLQRMCLEEITEMVMVILHEYCHESDSIGMTHDLLFYRDYHEQTLERLPHEVARIYASAVASRRNRTPAKEEFPAAL